MGKFTVQIWTDDPDFWYTDQPTHAAVWASEHCPSFYHFEQYDMSDMDSWSGKYDSGCEFFFENEEDAIMFQLRWGR